MEKTTDEVLIVTNIIHILLAPARLTEEEISDKLKGRGINADEVLGDILQRMWQPGGLLSKTVDFKIIEGSKVKYTAWAYVFRGKSIC